MDIYDNVMSTTGTDTPQPAGIEAAGSPQSFTDIQDGFLPQLDQTQFGQLFTSSPIAPPMSAPKTGTIGSGRYAGKPLPIDGGSGKASKIVNFAQSMIGVPYVWGGTSQNGVDCSGLVQLAYHAAGIDLPRVSYQQANQGKRVALNHLRPGDLVAWDNSTRNVGADHIAVYVGNGQIIEAARPGTNVRLRTLGSNEGAVGVRIL